MADEIQGAPDVQTSKKSSEEVPYRPGEEQIVDWVESLYNDAEQGRDDQCDTDAWEDNLATWWGDQWPSDMPSYKPRIMVNEIKSLGLQELSDLTDSRLKIYVQKDKTSGKADRDEIVESTIQTFWGREFCDLVVAFAALDAIIQPLGFIQTGWNPHAQNGQGEVIYRTRDPKTVYPDPDAENDDDLAYMILTDVMDIPAIRRDFPETGRLVQPEGAYSIKSGDDKSRPAPRAGSMYTGPLYTQTKMSGVPGYKKARARVLTCIVEDDEKQFELREIKGQLQQVEVAKYPHKRLIMVANRRVLYDEDCPYLYAPLIHRVMLQPSGHAYWPRQSLVQEFASIQATASKLDSLVAENALRMNVGEIFADADSGLNPKTYGGIPGVVYLIKPGSKVNKTYPQAMPGDMVNAGEHQRGFIRSTMGYPTSRTGAGTHGNIAAELAETEISQAMGLTRLKGRLLYQSVQRSVEGIFARMAQFYTTVRHLPYIDQGDLRSIKWTPVASPDNYAVHVDPASFQIRSKTMMQRMFLTLAKLGKMPTGRLLKMLEIPDADRIAAELKEELVLMAAARMKQQGAKGKKG